MTFASRFLQNFFLGCLVFCAVASGVCHGQNEPVAFEWQPDDRVAVLGNGLAERMQHDGWMETFIQSRLPQLHLVFRNLGFNGDELTIRMRSQGFGSPVEWLRRTEASVVFAFFGQNESFAGPDGLDSFRRDLSEFIDKTTSQVFNGKNPPRLVLFAPIAFEATGDRLLPDGVEINKRLELYTDAMQRVAEERNVTFVDLYRPTARAFADSVERHTINGMHLNDAGNRVVARLISDALCGGPAPEFSAPHDSLRQAVVDKNFYWFHRYRTTDGFSTYGGRRGLGVSEWTPSNEAVMKRELEVLDAMTANRDERVWALAGGSDLAVDDSHTPELLPVASNKPGPLPDGAYQFLGGEEAIGKMTVAPGMKVELFASEKQFAELENPVQLAVDTRGRLWVATWPSYPHWKPKDAMNDKLLILEDTDGDGRADVCKTFADGLHNPTGFEFYNGGVYVAQVPDLWFLKDTDGDDRADVRIRVLGGIDSADTHHSINSFVLGPGGGVYFQEGIFHRTQIETPFGAPVRVTDGGVYRYDPKSQQVDVYSAYSFPNPHGHVFDYWGIDVVHDGTGAKPIFGPSFSGHTEFPQRHPGAPGIYAQRTRPCSGTTILSSSHFPEANRDTLLVGNVIGFQGILQYRLEPDGAGLKGTEIEPIVYSSDVNFRPSDVEVGGDGAIYFSDWQNPLIGHMQHNLRDSNRDHRHGRIYRVTHRGASPLTPPKIAGQPLEELLDLLTERDNGVRYRVKIELSDRDTDEVVAALDEWVKQLDARDESYQHHLLEALWVHQHHHVVNEPLLEQLLRSSDFRVRAAAARVLRSWRLEIPHTASLVERLVHDEHPRVRMMGVLICSDSGSAPAAELALEASRYPCDKFLEYTLREAVATLAPDWKPALAQDSGFCDDNPAAIDYLLHHVGPAELVKLHRNKTVFQALLTRADIDQADRLEALEGLAELKRRDPLLLLLEQIEAQDETSAGSHEELVTILAGWDVAELASLRQRIKTNLSAVTSLTRQGALAALMRLDASPGAVWEAYAKSDSAILDLLWTIPRIPEPEVRTRFYEFVRPLLTASHERSSTSTDEEQPVQFAYYERDSISDVRTTTLADWSPDKLGQTSKFGLEIPGIRSSWMVLRQRASLDVPTAGRYTFHLGSDDGARLYIDGQELIDNDGLHGTRFRNASVELEAGPHDVVVTYYNATGGSSLELMWEGPGLTRESVPAASLSPPEDVLHSMAVIAMRHIPGHEAEKIRDLSRCLQEKEAAPEAILALASVPLEQWDAEQAAPVIEAVRQHVAAIPLSRRTAASVAKRLEFARQLTQVLAPNVRQERLATLEQLQVTALKLETIPHRMAYDREKLVVPAGRPVELTLRNQDNMPHNWVLTLPGAMTEVGLLGESTANTPDALERHYVPDSDQVLVASRLLQYRESQAVIFMAPREPGIYPYICTYPGHWRRMFGALYVVEDVPAYKADPETYLADHQLLVHDDLLRFNRPLTDWTFTQLQPALNRLGDAASIEQGRELFRVANCVACHRMNKEGNEFGPDLAKLDAKLTPTDILQHVLDPSKQINEKFHSYSFMLASGRTVTGLISGETDEAFQIVVDPLASCDPTIVVKDEIEEQFKSSVSLMPNGLLDRLTEDEILQLLAYIVSRGSESSPLYQQSGP